MLAGDGIEQRKTYRKQEEQKERSKQLLAWFQIEPLGDAVRRPASDDPGGDEPGQGGGEERKLQRSCGAGWQIRIWRGQK
jgi:hypothetical protein